MKYLLIILTLLSTLCFSEEDRAISELVESTPNIVFGKVYLSNDNSCLVNVNWQLKGSMNSSVYEITLRLSDANLDSSHSLNVGDRVLIFVNREVVEPLKRIENSDVRLSRFDFFDGQCAYIPIKDDNAYSIVSDVYSKVSGENLASALAF